MNREDINRLHELVLDADLHRSSEHERSISVTTLIGPTYKAHHALNNTPKTNMLPPMKKRSSGIGTGFHLLAEKALENNNDVLTEVYKEMYIQFADLWLSGTADVMVLNEDGKYELGDFKTGYGKSFDNTDLAVYQMSVYRWLNRHMDIADIAHVWFVSQSNNAMEHIEVELMSLADTQAFIRRRIIDIQEENLGVDCQYNIDGQKRPYNMCEWCEYECPNRR